MNGQNNNPQNNRPGSKLPPIAPTGLPPVQPINPSQPAPVMNPGQPRPAQQPMQQPMMQQRPMQQPIMQQRPMQQQPMQQRPMQPAQKPAKKKKNIFWIIMAAFTVVIIGIIIGICVTMNSNNEEELSYEDVTYLYHLDGTMTKVEDMADFYKKTDVRLPVEERWFTERVKLAYAVYEKDDNDPRGYSNKYADIDENEQTVVTYGMQSYDNPDDGILYFDVPHIYVIKKTTTGDEVTETGETITLNDYETNTSGNIEYIVITLEDYNGLSEEKKSFKCNYCFENHKTAEHRCNHCGGVGHQSDDCCTICQSVNHTKANHVCTKCKVEGHGEKEAHCKDCGKYGHKDKTDLNCDKYEKPTTKTCNYCEENHKTEDHTCEKCGEKGHGKKDCTKPDCEFCGADDHIKTKHVCTRCQGTGHSENECAVEKCDLCGSTKHGKKAHPCTNCKGLGHESKECCTICKAVTDHKTDGHVCEKCGGKGHAKAECSQKNCEYCGSEDHTKQRHSCPNCGKLGHTDMDCPEQKCPACGSTEHKTLTGHTCEKCGNKGHDEKTCPAEACKYCKSTEHTSALHMCETCGNKGHDEKSCEAPKCARCGGLDHTDGDNESCQKPHDCEYCGKRKGHDTIGHVCELCFGTGHDKKDCSNACLICKQQGHVKSQHQCSGQCGKLGVDKDSSEYPCKLCRR